MEEDIREIMEDVLGVDASDISSSFDRNDADLWDSMNHLRLITGLEEAFSIQFTMQEIQEIDSYSAILTAVKGHQTAK